TQSHSPQPTITITSSPKASTRQPQQARPALWVRSSVATSTLLPTMNMPINPAMAPWMTAMMARIMRSALLEGLQRLLLADGRSGLLPAHLSVDLLGGVAVFGEVAGVMGRGSASEGFDLGAELGQLLEHLGIVVGQARECFGVAGSEPGHGVVGGDFGGGAGDVADGDLGLLETGLFFGGQGLPVGPGQVHAHGVAHSETVQLLRDPLLPRLQPLVVLLAVLSDPGQIGRASWRETEKASERRARGGGEREKEWRGE